MHDFGYALAQAEQAVRAMHPDALAQFCYLTKPITRTSILLYIVNICCHLVSIKNGNLTKRIQFYSIYHWWAIRNAPNACRLFGGGGTCCPHFARAPRSHDCIPTLLKQHETKMMQSQFQNDWLLQRELKNLGRLATSNKKCLNWLVSSGSPEHITDG